MSENPAGVVFPSSQNLSKTPLIHHALFVLLNLNNAAYGKVWHVVSLLQRRV